MKFSRKKALIALSISLSQTVMSQNLLNPGNNVYAEYKENAVTSKYCPYEQSDHLVDGLWWFYDRTSGNAFFILSRILDNGEIKLINKSPYLEGLKKKHFTVIHINELKGNYQKNGENSFDEYLYRSFMDAGETKGNNPYQEYPNLLKDNPLENLADYFDGYNGGEDQYFFWRRIFSRDLNEQGPIIKPQSKVFVNFGSKKFDLLSKEYPKMGISDEILSSIQKSLVLSHGTKTKKPTLNSHLSSLNTLRHIGIKPSWTSEFDERLKNKGFVFTTLCLDNVKSQAGQYIKHSPTKIFFKNLEKLPIVVVSYDQLFAADSNEDDVYICAGKDLATCAIRENLSNTKRLLKRFIGENAFNEIVNKKTTGQQIRKNLSITDSTSVFPECRIPTYLILQNENFE